MSKNPFKRFGNVSWRSMVSMSYKNISNLNNLERDFILKILLKSLYLLEIKTIEDNGVLQARKRY
jgi:hypothetical protein